MRKYLTILALAIIIVDVNLQAKAQTMTKKILIYDCFETWTADFYSCISNEKLTLRNSVLYQDEEGQTHYANTERISSGILAKKQFILKNPVCSKAELFVFHGAGLNLLCNGVPVVENHNLPSTGWHVWNVPVKLLKTGINEFVFSGKGTLLIEPSLYPNRSARSFDEGKTWQFDNLGVNNGNGEYVVRLRLQQYPEKGIATSGIYDLLSVADKNTVHGEYISANDIQVKCIASIPDGTSIELQYRIGKTKIYNPASWSAWKPFRRKINNTWTVNNILDERFFQIQAILKTKNATVAPYIEKLQITASVKYQPADENIRVVSVENPQSIISRIPFAYQELNYRTQALRSMYNLDQVIKDGKTEIEKFVMLRNWARHTAPKGWDWGTSMWCPPWDALVILATNKQPAALCMCTHYSTIFTQCAIALGYTARQVILDHHCVAEIWSNELGKWILMDTGNSQNPEMNCHLEHNGVFLNALEIRNLWKQNRANEIKFVYANESGITEKEKNDFESSYFKNFRRFAIPLRNNFLGNPVPGEPEQGQSEYYCDLYLWWEDNCEPVESPEYGKTSNRVSDFYWTLNQTFFDLISSGKDTITVTLYNNVPQFSHYLVSIDGGVWEKTPAQFDWKIHNGRNEIAVKSVNLFGLECPVSRVTIEKQIM